MKIKENRKKLNMTQDELAKELNIAKSTISKWENGTMEPAIGEIKKMAVLFEVTIDELIGGAVIPGKVKDATKAESPFYIVDMDSGFGSEGGHGKVEHYSVKFDRSPQVIKVLGIDFDPINILWMILYSIPHIVVLTTLFIQWDWFVNIEPANVPIPLWKAVLITGAGTLIVLIMMIWVRLCEIIFRRYLPTWMKSWSKENEYLECHGLPFWIFLKIFKVEKTRKGVTEKGKKYHKNTFLAYEKYFDMKSYDGEYTRVSWKEVLDIHLPILNKSRTINTPHKTVSKIKSDKLFGETYTQTNKTMVSHTEKYQEYGNIEITIKGGKKYTINSTKDRDFSLLVSVWKRQ